MLVFLLLVFILLVFILLVFILLVFLLIVSLIPIILLLVFRGLLQSYLGFRLVTLYRDVFLKVGSFVFREGIGKNCLKFSIKRVVVRFQV
jgi:hypothetical protein